MVFEAFHRHGGRLQDAKTAFSAAPEPWLDLSTGVSPYPYGPYPWQGGEAADINRLPDPSCRGALEAAAAYTFGVSPSCVTAVPGADHALRILPYMTKAAHVAVVSPTYGGHREAWAAAGARVSIVSRKSLDEVDADAVVLVNPNNPDGAIYAPDVLIALAERLAARAGWLIIDESFVELVPEISLAARVHGRIVVLRSFGKFYGLPGVRLGFVVADPQVIALLRPLLGDWPVSAQAIALGLPAYADLPWQTAMRQRLQSESAVLDRRFVETGFVVLGGTALFRLVSHPNARNTFHRLGEAGILVRPFADQPHWLRIGLPPREALARLSAVLETLP